MLVYLNFAGFTMMYFIHVKLVIVDYNWILFELQLSYTKLIFFF